MATIIYKSSAVMETVERSSVESMGFEWIYIDGRVTPPERHNTMKFLPWASGMLGSVQIVLVTKLPGELMILGKLPYRGLG